jgi:hypothetical protein
MTKGIVHQPNPPGNISTDDLVDRIRALSYQLTHEAYRDVTQAAQLTGLLLGCWETLDELLSNGADHPRVWCRG